MRKLKKNEPKLYPGSQRKIYGFNLVFFFLALLAIIFLLLTAYALIRQNIDITKTSCFSWEILDAKTACSIFITLISLLLVRHQFITGFRPKIIYECKKVKTPNNPELEAETTYWQVIIRNVGLGTAIFLDYKFILNDESNCSVLSFKEAIERLKQHDLLVEVDYSLSNITKGFALTSKEEKIIFELRLPIGHKIKQLDTRMVFEGYLGGKYIKEVYCIPREGIPNKGQVFITR